MEGEASVGEEKAASVRHEVRARWQVRETDRESGGCSGLQNSQLHMEHCLSALRLPPPLRDRRSPAPLTGTSATGKLVPTFLTLITATCDDVSPTLLESAVGGHSSRQARDY